MTGPGLGAFSHVTVGVRSLDEAIAFWSDNFGLEATARREGPDPGLAALWDIDPAGIGRQAMMFMPGARLGGMHLVEFRNPAPPAREGAKPYDLLPKNLDLYTVDLPARYEELQTAGHRFRGPWVTMPGPAGLSFREAHLPGHDEINVVLLEIIGPGYETPLTRQGFAAIGPLVTIVPEGNAEVRFYVDVLGMATTLELLITGPDIERMVGLPPGAGLDLRVFGDPDEPLGRIELIDYQQVQGENLYHRATPPATGILHVNYRVPDLAPFRSRLRKGAVPFREEGRVAALYGTGDIISLRSPAGFRIEVQEHG